MRYQPSPAFRRTTLSFLAAALLLGATAATAGGASRPTIQLSNGREPISSLFIGSHLAAGLTGGQPYVQYTFVLRNADATAIASASATADAAGTVPTTPLWAHTGVVGCDSDATANAALSRFLNFEDADDALAGTSLELAAIDEDGVALATRYVSILRAVEEVPYFSDGDACPRSFFVNDEHIYLSYFNPNRSNKPKRAIFLVNHTAGGLVVGDPLEDVRQSRPPQFFEVPQSGNVVTVKIWDADQTEPGQYGAVSRPYAPADGVPPAVLLAGDYVVGIIDGLTTTGLNVSVNGCSCIDPPGQ